MLAAAYHLFLGHGGVSGKRCRHGRQIRLVVGAREHRGQVRRLLRRFRLLLHHLLTLREVPRVPRQVHVLLRAVEHLLIVSGGAVWRARGRDTDDRTLIVVAHFHHICKVWPLCLLE